MYNVLMFVISGLSTFLLLFFRKRKYNMRWSVILTILVIVGVVGYFGAALGSYLSYGSWRGIRFYSKALFVTIALAFVAKITKVDTAKTMDYYAPIDIFALIIMKLNCLRAGCCSGIELFVSEKGTVLFPSQATELFVAAILFVIVIILEKKSKCEGYRYFIYLLIYGITRFILDYLRGSPGKIIYMSGVGISITQLLCVLLIAIGIFGVYRGKTKNKLSDLDPER